MAYIKKETTENEVFMLTLPLEYEAWERHKLDVLFQCYNNVKNALISKKLKQLKQLERDKLYITNKTELKEVYTELNHLKDCKADKADIKALEIRKTELCDARNELIDKYGLSPGSFEKDIHLLQHHYCIVMTHEIANIAVDVKKEFEAYLYKNGKEIKFSAINEFRTITGKTNKGLTCFCKEGYVTVGRKKNPLTLGVKFSRTDKYKYEEQALRRNIHFCKLVRRPVDDGWQYFVQIAFGGTPPVKIDPDTGEVKNYIGEGNTGIDIGTQTVAVVSDTKAALTVLAENIEDVHKELRRVSRAIDRCRRANNPDMFYSDGRIIPLNKLSKDMITGRGKRKWIKSKRQLSLERKRRALCFRESYQRILAHNKLANELVCTGNTFYVETMNFRALAKKTKEDKTDDKGKHKSKKRFGKSISHKAPATFINILKNKVESHGGKFIEIDTWNAKASQYDHSTQAYNKKKLGRRWHTLINGDKIQRDLYSAFLIQHTNSTYDGFIQDQLEKDYGNFKVLHDNVIYELIHNNDVLPSSMGIHKKRAEA